MSHSVDNSDKGRTLTDAGLLQAVRIGEYIQARGEKPDLILCSPYRRTLETAHLIAEYAEVEVVEAVPWLASGMNADTALEELQAYKSFESIAIVGHQPDLGYVLESFSAEGEVFEVEQGAVFEAKGELLEKGFCISEILYGS